MSEERMAEFRRLYRAAFGASWPQSDEYLEELWTETATKPGVHFAGRRANMILLMRENSGGQHA